MGDRGKGGLILVADLGGSLTKTIGGTSYERRRILAMEPEVIEVPRGLLDPEAFAVGVASPKDRAWVGLDGSYYAVGHHARRVANTNPALRRPKAELAVQKILAAAWVLASEFRIPSPLPLALCCLLPPSERGDDTRVEAGVREALERGFETPTGTMTGRLVEFNCKAEGSGLFMKHRVKRGAEAINRSEVAVVMSGYRNTSVMLFSRGAIAGHHTSGLGFASLLSRVVQIAGRYTVGELTPTVAGYLETGDETRLRPLLREDGDGKRLVEAIALARKQREIELRAWFEEVIPSDVEEVLLCGGSVEGQKEFLTGFFAGKRVFLHAGIELPSDARATGLGYRLGDAWCIWEYFVERLSVKRRAVGRAAVKK